MKSGSMVSSPNIYGILNKIMELFEQACQEIDEQKELIIDGMLRSIKEIQVKHTELKEAPHIAT